MVSSHNCRQMAWKGDKRALLQNKSILVERLQPRYAICIVIERTFCEISRKFSLSQKVRVYLYFSENGKYNLKKKIFVKP
jgi:hypothetical protein